MATSGRLTIGNPHRTALNLQSLAMDICHWNDFSAQIYFSDKGSWESFVVLPAIPWEYYSKHSIFFLISVKNTLPPQSQQNIRPCYSARHLQRQGKHTYCSIPVFHIKAHYIVCLQKNFLKFHFNQKLRTVMHLCPLQKMTNSIYIERQKV